jgi:hypothetical protein
MSMECSKGPRGSRLLNSNTRDSAQNSNRHYSTIRSQASWGKRGAWAFRETHLSDTGRVYYNSVWSLVGRGERRVTKRRGRRWNEEAARTVSTLVSRVGRELGEHGE